MIQNVGERIKNRRIELGMTQKELAEKVGYASKVSITNIENKRDIPMKKLKPICDALDIEVWDLMGWEAPELELTSEERQLVIDYRRSDQKDKEVVQRLLKYALGMKHEN